tara:strand:- start:2962 stop:3450 length:489 start_codon:yes stop_codon:yes gene_type:complete
MKRLLLLILLAFSMSAFADVGKVVTDPEILKQLNFPSKEDQRKTINDFIATFTGEYLCNEVSDKLIWFNGKTIDHEDLPSLDKNQALLVSVDGNAKTIQFEGNYLYGINLEITGRSILGIKGVGHHNDGQLYSIILEPKKLRLTRTSMGEVRVLSANCDKID